MNCTAGGRGNISPALKKAIAGRLQDRVMFGCDFPVLRYEKVMDDWNAEGYSTRGAGEGAVQERGSLFRGCVGGGAP